MLKTERETFYYMNKKLYTPKLISKTDSEINIGDLRIVSNVTYFRIAQYTKGIIFKRWKHVFYAPNNCIDQIRSFFDSTYLMTFF